MTTDGKISKLSHTMTQSHRMTNLKKNFYRNTRSGALHYFLYVCPVHKNHIFAGHEKKKLICFPLTVFAVFTIVFS